MFKVARRQQLQTISSDIIQSRGLLRAAPAGPLDTVGRRAASGAIGPTVWRPQWAGGALLRAAFGASRAGPTAGR